MSNKEIRIPHSKIRKPDEVTQVTVDAMKGAGVDVHQNEVSDMYDDHDKGVRVLSVQKKQYFLVPEMPWHRKEE